MFACLVKNANGRKREKQKARNAPSPMLQRAVRFAA